MINAPIGNGGAEGNYAIDCRLISVVPEQFDSSRNVDVDAATTACSNARVVLVRHRDASKMSQTHSRGINFTGVKLPDRRDRRNRVHFEFTITNSVVYTSVAKSTLPFEAMT